MDRSPRHGTLTRSGSSRSVCSASDGASSLCSSRRFGSLGAEIDYLEMIAETFQERLLASTMVVKRKTLLHKTAVECFMGQDAVTVLQEVLQEEQDRFTTRDEDDEDDDIDSLGEHQNHQEAPTSKFPVTVKRAEALQKGRQMMKEFHFFKHATMENTNLLDSDTDWYVFDHNLPCQVRRMKKKYPTYWDKMRLFEKHVECKDRRHMFRVFPDCFVAQEAVDMLVRIKLVRSRNEAVHLVHKLNQKVFCCEHVCSEHEFKDDYLFFHLIPPSQRMPEPLGRGRKKHSHKHRSKSAKHYQSSLSDGMSRRRRRSKSPRNALADDDEVDKERRRRSKSPKYAFSGDHVVGSGRKSRSKSPQRLLTDEEVGEIAKERRRRSKSPKVAIYDDEFEEIMIERRRRSKSPQRCLSDGQVVEKGRRRSESPKYAINDGEFEEAMVERRRHSKSPLRALCEGQLDKTHRRSTSPKYAINDGEFEEAMMQRRRRSKSPNRGLTDDELAESLTRRRRTKRSSKSHACKEEEDAKLRDLSDKTDATSPLSDESGTVLEPKQPQQAPLSKKKTKKAAAARSHSSSNLSERLLKATNKKRADDIRSRLARYKQETRRNQKQ